MLDYDTAHRLETVTDPMTRVFGLAYDGLTDRVETQTLPAPPGETREVHYDYDPDGNLASLVPPGQPGHGFTSTPVDLFQQYAPPDLGPGREDTNYTYDADRQLDFVDRPDGRALDPGYDAAGRLTTLTIPEGVVQIAYHPTSGHVQTVTAPGSVTLSYGYDGPLLTSQSWTGPVAGTVSRTYDDDLRVATTSVNGTQSVAFQYDNDSLLTQAGALQLTRHAQTGLVTVRRSGW